MFPTKEKQDSKSIPESTTKEQRTFESLDQFSLWLDEELDVLVSKFAEFETDKSVRKFFTRS